MRHAWKSWFHSCRIDCARRIWRARARVCVCDVRCACTLFTDGACTRVRDTRLARHARTNEPSSLDIPIRPFSVAEQSICIVAYARIRKKTRRMHVRTRVRAKVRAAATHEAFTRACVCVWVPMRASSESPRTTHTRRARARTPSETRAL